MLLIEEREFKDFSLEPFDLPATKIILQVEKVARAGREGEKKGRDPDSSPPSKQNSRVE